MTPLLISWMKITTWIVIIISFCGFFFHSFDPFYSLEGMILHDVYVDTVPSEKDLILYRFALSLFSLVSVIYGAIQLYAIRQLLEKGDRTFARLLFFMILIWVVGCTYLIIKFDTWSYFYSAGGMAAMWIPPLYILAFSRRK